MRLNISVALALEYEDVLKRENLVPGIEEPQIEELLDYIFGVSNLTPFVVVRLCVTPMTSVFWR